LIEIENKRIGSLAVIYDRKSDRIHDYVIDVYIRELNAGCITYEVNRQQAISFILKMY